MLGAILRRKNGRQRNKSKRIKKYLENCLYFNQWRILDEGLRIIESHLKYLLPPALSKTCMLCYSFWSVDSGWKWSSDCNNIWNLGEKVKFKKKRLIESWGKLTIKRLAEDKEFIKFKKKKEFLRTHGQKWRIRKGWYHRCQRGTKKWRGSDTPRSKIGNKSILWI